jgi:hypothetical protein
MPGFGGRDVVTAVIFAAAMVGVAIGLAWLAYNYEGPW